MPTLQVKVVQLARPRLLRQTRTQRSVLPPARNAFACGEYGRNSDHHQQFQLCSQIWSKRIFIYYWPEFCVQGHTGHHRLRQRETRVGSEALRVSIQRRRSGDDSSTIPGSVARQRFARSDALHARELFNRGTTVTPLSSVTFPYWLVNSNPAISLVFASDYAAVGCANVTSKLVTLTTPATMADKYCELGFTTAAGVDWASQQTGESRPGCLAQILRRKLAPTTTR